mgnify:CR=1 FL=1
MSLKDLKRLALVQSVLIILLIGAGAQVVDNQNQRIRDLEERIEDARESVKSQVQVNKRQDVLINKFNQMYYEFQHWKATGETDFPGG